MDWRNAIADRRLISHTQIITARLFRAAFLIYHAKKEEEGEKEEIRLGEKLVIC